MKQRILHYLDEFAKGKVNDLSTEIANELNLTKVQLIEKSKTVQSAILHHYSQFSISAIDAFFQKVIRSFTREAGLLGNFRLEVENDLVLRDVIEELMDELGEKTEQTKWVVDFSRDKLLEGENWNIRAALHEFTREIFKEEFQAIEDKLMKPEGEDNPYRHTMNLLYDLTSGFEKIMKEKAKGALVLLGQHGITADDFNYKDQGTVIKYFQEFAENRYFSSEGKRMQSAISDSKSWPGKKSRNYAKLVDLAERELLPILHDMVQYDNAHRTEYLTAKQILKNFYAFGLISHITQKLSAYKRENNIMLLSDAPKFLNGVINESDTPFIYEKVGSYFRNYLIDEFQDTSGFQWKNFQPLLKDALDQNQGSVIVGDVKQSIYRWRGGDQELLQEDVTRVMGKR